MYIYIIFFSFNSNLIFILKKNAIKIVKKKNVKMYKINKINKIKKNKKKKKLNDYNFVNNTFFKIKIIIIIIKSIY